jgi:hypothetical protein
MGIVAVLLIVLGVLALVAVIPGGLVVGLILIVTGILILVLPGHVRWP